MLKRLLGLSALLLLLAACTQPGTPAVTVTLTPAAGAAGVSIDSMVSAVFSAPMNADTMVEEAFKLTSEDGEVAGEISYNDVARRLTFTPDEPLEYATGYTASIADTVRSAAGGRLEGTNGGAVRWTFTTEAEPDIEPAVNAVTVTPDSASVLVGGPAQFEADVDAVGGASEEVTWTSDNEAVATVNEDGLATTHSAGEANITATSVADPTVSGSAVLTVSVVPVVTAITVTPSTAVLELGGEVQLTAAVEAAGGASEAVTWVSSNLAVATVDSDGLVTSVAPGSATVTATSAFNNSVSDTAAVTVLAPAVTGVTVTPDEETIDDGDTTVFVATVETVSGASEAVTWISSNLAVATVDSDGLVTGVAPGSATITATSAFDISKFGEAIINVAGVTTVDVEPATSDLVIGGTVGLTANVAALHGADESVNWTSDDMAVATVDSDGVVTGVAPGSATITATSAFDNSVSGTGTITVYSAISTDHYLTVDVVAGDDVPDQVLGVTGGLTPYAYTITTDPPPGFPEDYEDVPYDDMSEIGELRVPPAGITIVDGVLAGPTSIEDHGYYAFFIEITDALGQVNYIFVELDVSEAFMLAFENAEYAYPNGCGASTGAGLIQCPGTDFSVEGNEYRSIMPAADVLITGTTFPVTFSMALESGTASTRWAIDSATGIVGRSNAGVLGPGNSDPEHNGTRTYTVTATETGGEGRSASFEVTFEEAE